MTKNNTHPAFSRLSNRNKPRHSQCDTCGLLAFDRLHTACPKCGAAIFRFWSEADLWFLQRYSGLAVSGRCVL